MTPPVAFLVGLLAFVAPLGALWWHARRPWMTRRDALWTLAGPAGLAIAAFCAGPWSFTSVYLRYVLPIALAVVFVRALFRPPGRTPIRLVMWVSAAAGAVLAWFALRGLRYWGAPVALEFPLRGGVYAVLQGGNSTLMNPFHRSDPSERYALDLVRLSRLGARARHLIPTSLDDYEIFGDTIYSPCGGIVIQTTSDLPDNQPGRANVAHPSGNNVLLRAARPGFSSHICSKAA